MEAVHDVLQPVCGSQNINTVWWWAPRCFHPAASSLFLPLFVPGVSWSSFSWCWVLRDSRRSHPGEESHLLLFFKFSIHLNNTCFSVTLKFCCLLNKSAADSVNAAPFDLSCFVWASLFLLSRRFQDDSVALSSLFLYKHSSDQLFTVQTSKLSTQLFPHWRQLVWTKAQQLKSFYYFIPHRTKSEGMNTESSAWCWSAGVDVWRWRDVCVCVCL